MRILVAGITGQLGRGLVEVAADRDVEIVPLARRVGRRDAATRVRRTLRAGELAERTIEGDVSAPYWGLDRFSLRELAGSVDVVLNLAGETNWAAPTRRLVAVNALGATHGHAVARALAGSGEPPLYCYASSIHAAGAVLGQVPEVPFGALARRTPYEHAKWLAERRLLDPVRVADGPPVVIARIGGLVGNSATGETAKRNSLYMLADRLDLLPGGVLPLVRRGRVDMLPRDVAADLLLGLLEHARERPPATPLIAHVCAGEAAPTAEALLAALRGLDGGAVRVPRSVRMPARPVVWASQNFDRVSELSLAQRNALIGLRYVALDRWFERRRLAAAVGGPLPAPSADELARLAFERPLRAPAAPPRDPVLARLPA